MCFVLAGAATIPVGFRRCSSASARSWRWKTNDMHIADTLVVRKLLSTSFAALALLSVACDQGPATLQITAWGEDYVEDRIPAEVLVDGWEIEFSRFLVAIGEVEADGEALEGAFVVDLARDSGGAGHELGELTLPSGGRPMLSYRIAPLAGAAVENPSEDVMRLVDANASMWVEGQATKGDQTVGFAWPFETDVRYVECQSTTELVGGEASRSRLTFHADHLFYDDLDSEEPNVAFDLVASADTNDDGQVSVNELWERSISGETRYQVGDRDIVDLWTYLEALALTIGHIDGEGHCEIDG
jgi:hypothetical protein